MNSPNNRETYRAGLSSHPLWVDSFTIAFKESEFVNRFAILSSDDFPRRITESNNNARNQITRNAEILL